MEEELSVRLDCSTSRLVWAAGLLGEADWMRSFKLRIALIIIKKNEFEQLRNQAINRASV